MVEKPPLCDTLALRDLYARHALNALPPTQQLELLGWAESHALLSFLLKQGLLQCYAAASPLAWASLCRVSQLAEQHECSDEAHYSMLVKESSALQLALASAAPGS